jgi:CRISPR-associated endonuclease Csn1
LNKTLAPRKTLGLDLGTSSIGWALVDLTPDSESVIAAGVRIFPEGMDRTRGEKSLNQDRRVARSLRRQTYRRARRKAKLLHILQNSHLLPESQDDLDELFSNTDPYELRTKALSKKLEPYHIGRALYHLGQRRGYLSNRKTGAEKDGKVAAGISDIKMAMEEGNFPTLGAFLNSLNPHQQRLRGRYTHRNMYLSEFDAIWESQKKFYSNLLTPELRSLLHDAIFFQRPLKNQRHLIGQCEFEPDRKRAYAATLAAQEFRLWQSINNLKILHANGSERWLTDEERLQLHEFLSLAKTKSWEQIKKELGLLEGDRFNLENVRKSGMLGNQTANIVHTALKPDWKKMTPQQQEQLVFDLINSEDEDKLKRRLVRHYGFDEDKADKLLKKSLELPKGVMHLSHKAIRKILPHLKEAATPENRGNTYDKACMAAGYNHTKVGEQGTSQYLSLSTEDLRNPLVQRAMYQIRKVVNAIIREYGKPDAIRIEMARDLKNNAKQRNNIQKQQRSNEEANKEAETFLREELGFSNPSRTDKLKYRLWKECDKICPFTGESISTNALFVEPQFEIEHIIPYTRCLDDSFLNKTLCHRNANQAKGNLTPYEAFAGDKKTYSDILQRAKKLPYKKFLKFSSSAADDIGDFVSQQLNESRYIAVKTKEYLSQLEDVEIQPIKGGRITAQLRYAWGLNNILADNGEKTRLDHRHHAVDALVIALTNRRSVSEITRYVNSDRALAMGEVRLSNYPSPIPDIRRKAKLVIDNIIVSHKPQRKVSGPLHNEFLYSLQHDDDGQEIAVIRKNLANCKDSDLEKIRDARIRELALAHRKKSKNIKDAFANPENPFGILNKNGGITPVRKVRIGYNRSLTSIGKPLSNKNDKRRNVWTRGNHHVEIVETIDKKGKVKWGAADVITTMQATQRNSKNSSIPVVNFDHGKDRKLVAVLHVNDMVELDYKNRRVTARVQKMDMNANIVFREHMDADIKNWKLELRFSPESLRKSNIKLVEVNPIGKVLTRAQTNN